jgi:hypothetical protein
LSKIDVNELREQVTELVKSKYVYTAILHDPEMILLWCESFKFMIVYDETEKKFSCTGKITENFMISKPVETEVMKVRFNNIADNMNVVYYKILSYLSKILNENNSSL